MPKINAKSAQAKGRDVSVYIDYATTDHTVLFDTRYRVENSGSGTDNCINISVDDARKIRDALNDALALADEASARPTVKPSTTFVLGSRTYIFYGEPDISQEITDWRVWLESHADVIIDNNTGATAV